MIKRFVLFTVAALSTIITAIVGSVAHNTPLMIFGLVIIGLFGLAVMFWILKKIAKLIGNSLTSIIFISVLAVTGGILSYFNVLNSFAGYLSGALLGGLLLAMSIRRIAKYAQKSVIIGEVFSFITGYGIKSYLTEDSIVSKEVVIDEMQDYNNLVVVLKSNMGYKTKEASEAAKYALSKTYPEQSVEEKLKVALKYLDNKKHVVELSNN